MSGWVQMMEETGSLAAYRDPDERRRILLEADAEAIIADCEQFLDEPGVADAIPRMRRPVLMIAGEHDEVVAIMERAAREMPVADFVRVAGVAHTMCHCSWLLPYVEAFLQRVEAGAFAASTPA
jgi:pimeloyl-ACP methyl ester carboxylesterase